ncbi:unnamed protein product [Microthlaspi erraticum]|uniref:Uncharacterized protein n=1 Tax=Microthlaspi erraticum TaxID=1685480 RepID=A0A6D2HDY3_9BRAS|nr:unnamed protein product [Microthlaspi erraticum]
MEKLRIKTASTSMEEEEDNENDDDSTFPSSPEEINSKLVDYFGRALSKLSVEYKYPWPGTNQLPFLTDIPFARIPEPVYKTAADWIDKAHVYTLHKFIDWSFFWILDRLQGKPTDPHCELGVLAALSIILRSKPVVVDHILTLLSPPHHPLENLPEMIPFTVWMMAQVAKVDLRLGLSSWAKFLLPLLRDTFQFNPRSRILMLQLIKNVVSHPKARDILLSNAANKGVQRLFPVPSFEMLLPLTFPASFERVKDVTEWFQAVYPLLKEVALADAPGIKDMKQVTQSIFEFSLKFAEQGNAVLAKEATEIAVWCLTKNVDCCKHWDEVYMDNPKASVALLKKLVEEWEEDHSLKLSSSRRDTRILNRTMKSFVVKNVKGITEGGVSGFLYEEADMYCKEISTRLLSRGNGFPKCCVATVLVAVGAVATLVLSSSMQD